MSIDQVRGQQSMGGRSLFNSHWAVAILVLLSLLGVSVALADDESDPPGRAARLSYADGTVSLQPAGVEDWADATLNRPLTTGDKLWTDQNSRAEVDIGSAVIRLGSTTGFSFLNLDDRTAQMNVTAGTAIVHVRDMTDQVFEIDTPNVAVTLDSPGDYRVEVNDAGDATVVKVSNGDVEISAAGQSMQLHTQQASVFNGTDQVTSGPTSVGAPDSLDGWALEREHRFESAQAQQNQYVSPDVAGADDLANYGTWQDTPDYGPVWTPTAVAAGWSPYHDGRWVWVAPWGWTWVDDAPWGYAPFHYGRWAYVGTRWGWVPGPRRVRPIYAPALVAWVGGPGAAVSVNVGAGPTVGWFPLGPREVFVPSYRVSPNYVRTVNVNNTVIVNQTYITNVYENRVSNVTYVNRNRPGAVVAVSQDVFTSARPIGGRTVSIPAHDLAQFTARGAAPAITPMRESVLGHRPDIAVRRPPAAFANRPVVARTAPPPAPVTFARQQEAIRANGGRPLARSQITALQPAVAAQSARVRVVAPGPTRPIPTRGPQVGGGGQPGSSIADRERALHATPIAPSQQNANGPRGDRPPGNAIRQNEMRQNDQFRMNSEDARQNPDSRPAFQGRPTPEARPIPQAHPMPQAQPIQPNREIEQPRMNEAPRVNEAPQMRAEPRVVPQARPIEQPRTFQPPPPPPRPVEQPRAEIRAPEAPRPDQPRAQPVPRAAPAPQQRQAPPPQQHVEERRGNAKPGEPRR